MKIAEVYYLYVDRVHGLFTRRLQKMKINPAYEIAKLILFILPINARIKGGRESRVRGNQHIIIT
jgi:hypothetical protein